MTTQIEQILENELVEQLIGLGYEYLPIKEESDLVANFKRQLERLNGISLSETEMQRLLLQLNQGSIFERSKRLRAKKLELQKDDQETIYLSLWDQKNWAENKFQLIRQMRMDGRYKNIYDLNILINGLPLLHIELKRRGIEMKEAFNQIHRYSHQSFLMGQALFSYTQLFVISNGVNTKYFANNKTGELNFKQTFYWANKENQKISRLEEFAQHFLAPPQLFKMISRYMVLSEANKRILVMRPYQCHATEAILNRVKNNGGNGYIWHTTGSGKTLTSFKSSQLLQELPKVKKVVFVVDRKDLDYQTIKEFDSFSKDCVSATENSKQLIQRFLGQDKLIVTTIQKLNSVIHKKNKREKLLPLQEEEMVFIFDECHRSQFGESHRRIKDFFKKVQLFGFTGTPIQAKNAMDTKWGKQSTKSLFDDCLHKYIITDAIRDENVLRFLVEYVGRYKKTATANEIDIEVEDIDRQELLEHEYRLEKIVDYIIKYHPIKTKNKKYNAIFCLPSIPVLNKYYEIFKRKKAEGAHDLNIACIFSYGSNESPEGQDETQDGYTYRAHSRDRLEEAMMDYNASFNANYNSQSSQSFDNYYKDIAKRLRDGQIDILLVVNMFLTGFDSPRLNTLYVDKNLRYHGLIQAFSRTNRLMGSEKSQGNIVCFRNLKQATDDALLLYSDKDAPELAYSPSYEEQREKFDEKVMALKNLVPTVDSVDFLPSEEEELAFVQGFRELIRLQNMLSAFVDFDLEQTAMQEQEFADYKSKYLDLYEKVRQNRKLNKTSVLEEVDFDLELIQRDEINVVYILQLLQKAASASAEKRSLAIERLLQQLQAEVSLRSKKDLIEKFIRDNLPKIEEAEDIPDAFEEFMRKEQAASFQTICQQYDLDQEKFEQLVKNYLYSQKMPSSDQLLASRKEKPKLLERNKIAQGIREELEGFVGRFME